MTIVVEPGWIVQDVFSSGMPGPGFGVHEDRADADREALERGGVVLPCRTCSVCGSLLGLEQMPLQGGCNECRSPSHPPRAGAAGGRATMAWVENIRYTEAQWRAEGGRRFGDDPMAWRFICPACGHVASVRDWKEAGAPETAVAFSCVGRWAGARREAIGGKGAGPCNYAGGGLFGLNPVEIEGRGCTYFDFAPTT